MSEIGFFNVCLEAKSLKLQTQQQYTEALEISSPSRQHLEQLMAEFPRLQSEINLCHRATFPFSINVPKALWVDTVMALTHYINYCDGEANPVRLDEEAKKKILELVE